MVHIISALSALIQCIMCLTGMQNDAAGEQSSRLNPAALPLSSHCADVHIVALTDIKCTHVHYCFSAMPMIVCYCSRVCLYGSTGHYLQEGDEPNLSTLLQIQRRVSATYEWDVLADGVLQRGYWEMNLGRRGLSTLEPDLQIHSNWSRQCLDRCSNCNTMTNACSLGENLIFMTS